VTKVGHPSRGQISAVKPSPAEWGRKVDVNEWVAQGNNVKDFPGVHTIIKADMTLAEAKMYMQQWTEPVIHADGSEDTELIKPRLYMLELDRAVTVGAVTDPDGRTRVTKLQTEQLLRNQKTLQTVK